MARAVGIICFGFRAAAYLVLVSCWLGSYGEGEHLSFRGESGYGSISCMDGILCVTEFGSRAQSLVGFERPIEFNFLSKDGNPDFAVRKLTSHAVDGFAVCSYGLGAFVNGIPVPDPRVSPGRIEGRGGSIPLWSIALFAGFIEIALAYPKVRRARRRKLGCCLNCGYDLRASGTRCPECGQMAAASV